MTSLDLHLLRNSPHVRRLKWIGNDVRLMSRPVCLRIWNPHPRGRRPHACNRPRGRTQKYKSDFDWIPISKLTCQRLRTQLADSNGHQCALTIDKQSINFSPSQRVNYLIEKFVATSKKFHTALSTLRVFVR